MMRIALLTTALTGLFLSACQEVDVTVPEAGPSPTVTVDDDGTVPEATTEPEDCAVVSAADGAPAPVTMQDSFFEPQCIAMSATQGLTLTNVGEAIHNFSVRDAGVDIDVEPEAEVNTEEIGGVVEPGTHEFFCKYHEQQGMVGTLTVE